MDDASSAPSGSLKRSSVVLTALVMVLGLESLRMLFPSLVWYLRESAGAPSTTLALYAFLTFGLGYLSPLLRRFLGPRGSLRTMVGLLAVLRITEQIVQEPAFDLWLSMAASAAFLLTLPLLLTHFRAVHVGGGGAAAIWAYGLLLGLALDSAIKGLTITLDLSWIQGILPILAVLLLAGSAAYLAWREPGADTNTASDSKLADGMTLIAFGPFLLLQAFVFQNHGAVAALSGLSYPLAFLLIGIGNLFAIAGAATGFAYARSFRPIAAIAVSLLLIANAIFLLEPPGFFPVILVAAQAAMGWGWALIASVSLQASRRGAARTTVVLTTSMLLFLVMAFLYFVSLDIPIPIPRQAYLPAAAVIFGLGLSLAGFRFSAKRAEPGRDPVVLYAASALLAAPCLILLLWNMRPNQDQPSGRPARVLTYNLHSAFDIRGVQNPEMLAQIIEQSEADLIGLQEVSRGWLINGSTDMVSWFTYRLQTPILFQGTVDPWWGNAITGRLPLLESGQAALPGEGILIDRGYLWATYDIGRSQPLLMINTHLHQIESEPQPRVEQVAAILDFWAGRPFTVFVGDLNATPDTLEMAQLRNAGWIDAWAEVGGGRGYTWHASKPTKRIDYIWQTPDLIPSSAAVIESTASDHLPIVIENAE